ncbi:hypothetical protein A3F02_03735 [Candidatus Curtissbacteria bacterium RIFCSPHIGHO2_12_FULL_38_9b]|uniref:Nudix hydrolase domain-containing protein n=2 Tax=Candidatus Curtissiibacteriota TaxID=1752717 RepID=A0A1F5H0L1_9BACT|nr:MAG: hypothetical protein A3A48_01545 [Candidatus Curtissbacteria bacterium RIFCSPLOWO2_01_FULL_37_9]OGD97567.1 MAG: hypothetical protein A3F02_03735 [Candidatus Curtissbacteria bacterium RIFCSPHIGHO2_12_FULL_38_9b]
MTLEREGQSKKPDLKNVSEIDDQVSRGWKVELNGEVVDEVSSIRLIQERMGVYAEYGKTPGGWDGLALEEVGGGGSVTVPYLNIDDEIYIGVVEENRPNAGGMVLNVPRGFMDPGETHFQTAKRELTEETGYEPVEKRIQSLEGDPMNPNSTYFVTKGDGGVRVYKVEIREDEVMTVVHDADKPEGRVYAFNPEVLNAESKMGEKVMKSRFIHWSKVIKLNDMFTVAAVGRLLAQGEKAS